jgi:DNA polymerase
MACAANYGIPLDLARAAKAVGVVEQEDPEGMGLRLQMGRPCRFEGRKPVWWDDPEKLRRLGEYCRGKVRIERALAQRLRPLSTRERELYLLDQRINDRGIGLDVPLARAARDCSAIVTQRANKRLDELTGGAVRGVTAVADMTRWLNDHGVPCEGVGKDEIREMQQYAEPSPTVRQVLQIRSETAKSSVTKLESMLACADADCRMRGLLVYHGGATGRWAGRGPQPQNLPRGEVKGVEAYIPLILERNIEVLDLCDAPLAIISSMLRSAIVAGPGHKLIAGDYSAVEARVLAWLSGHHKLLDIFRRGDDPYTLMAAEIYGIPLFAVTKDQRALGKQAVLGLGYQMGAPTFARSCARSGIGIREWFAHEVVQKYRAANQPIVGLWDALNSAAINAMEKPRIQFALKSCDVRLQYHDSWLYLRLPSGRTLKYAQPQLDERATPWGEMRECVTFMDFDSLKHQWQRTALYGGLLAENVTQAVARDLLADAMLLLESRGYPIVLTVHDEIVCEVPVASRYTLEKFLRLMMTVPMWAAGCPVKVEAWEGKRYRK